MTKPILTPDLAHSAAWDAGNRSMRAAGRECWNEDDYNACVHEHNRLMTFLMPNHPTRAA